MTPTCEITPAQRLAQLEYADALREILSGLFLDAPGVYFHAFGCQGNVSDGERMMGLLLSCGFVRVEHPEEAKLIILNTCAVREHAQERALGNVGRLKALKEADKRVKIALGGCVVQQNAAREKLQTHYGFIDLLFGTHVWHRLPELLYKVYSGGKRVCDVSGDGVIAEDIPIAREKGGKAFVPVMYGCDNFCSYCVVPLVRGRERSRRVAPIVEEVRGLIATGCSLITLLGQNVNSYAGECDFPQLLKTLDALDGDFKLRFVTSHPKDCSPALLDVMASGKHTDHCLHLPVQSGSDAILKKMNRGYTRAAYLEKIAYAKRVMPDLRLTSDILIGFPGETDADFAQTLELVDTVCYASLYTFIYSPREGTAAAALDDPTPRTEKVRRLEALTALQARIEGKLPKVTPV